MNAKLNAHDLQGRLAGRLAAALALRTEALPHDVTERLRVSREQALARARAARQPEAAAEPVRDLRTASGSVLLGGARGAAVAAGGMPGAPASWFQRAASLLPILLLLAGLIAVDRLSDLEQVRAAAEIDALLLADDLPPDAYSDPGFGEYLRTPPP
jgi:hypothetical protein